MKARALVAWNLRRIRVRRGISQERLAYDAQVDRSYVGGLERQTENPTIDLLDRLSSTLDVPLGEFFAQPAKGTPAPNPSPRAARRQFPSANSHKIARQSTRLPAGNERVWCCRTGVLRWMMPQLKSCFAR